MRTNNWIFQSYYLSLLFFVNANFVEKRNILFVLKDVLVQVNKMFKRTSQTKFVFPNIFLCLTL